MDTLNIVFATNNAHKLTELRQVVPSSVRILSLKEVGIQTEIPEDHATLEENARQKALFIQERTEHAVLADDTGLEVDALDGAPGVYSARYAGPACSSEENVVKLLTELQGVMQRSARFRTVLAFSWKGSVHMFEGTVEGQIRSVSSGSDGFGYDPVFQPEGHSVTFAEMPLDAKNAISHRGRATRLWVDFLREQIS